MTIRSLARKCGLLVPILLCLASLYSGKSVYQSRSATSAFTSSPKAMEKHHFQSQTQAEENYLGTPTLTTSTCKKKAEKIRHFSEIIPLPLKWKVHLFRQTTRRRRNSFRQCTGGDYGRGKNTKCFLAERVRINLG